MHINFIHRHSQRFLNVEANCITDTIRHGFDAGAIFDDYVKLNINLMTVVSYFYTFGGIFYQGLRQTV